MAMEIIKFLNDAEKVRLWSGLEAKPPRGGFPSNRLILIAVLFTFSFLLFPFSASAGVIRKPPNNLGLIAYWPMDEGAGTVVTDHSGNGRNGTFAGTGTMPSWGNGKQGKALDFSGITTGNGRIGISALNVTNTHTVSMWIRLSGNCTSYGNLFSADGDTGLYCFRSGVNNRITYYYASSDHFNTTNISLNQWRHVVVTNNGGSATFYLDGVADGTAATALTYSATVIGNDTLSEDFPGRIDDLRVYNRALSASEVLALYQSGSAKVGLTDLSPSTLKNGLTGHWTFDGKDMINNVADVSGNGNNGTLTSFTATTTVPGKIGQALNFDGANDNVVTGSLMSNFITATDGTISVWMRPTAPATTIANESAIRNSGTAVSSSGLLEFGIHQANITSLGENKIWLYNQLSSNYVGVDYNLNEWIHITWVHTGGTLYAYKNGELAGSVSSGNTPLTSNLMIGKNWCCNASTNHWKGDLDDVRTWNRALTASEIKQVYNIGAGQKISTTKTPVGTLQTGLRGHWTFDGKDMINNVADMSGNGNNGTLTSFTATTTVIGKIGQGLTFNGISQNIALGTSSTIQPGTNSFSVSVWYKGLKGSVETFVAGGTGCCNHWHISHSAAVFSVFGNGDVTKSYTLPADNDWHHIVIVLDRSPSPDTLEAYIDGVSQGSATNTLDNQNLTVSGGTVIGRGTWLSGGFRQGPIDDVRIYNRVLSASEVLQLYKLGK